jgi:Rieske Fe-S protein
MLLQRRTFLISVLGLFSCRPKKNLPTPDEKVPFLELVTPSEAIQNDEIDIKWQQTNVQAIDLYYSETLDGTLNVIAIDIKTTLEKYKWVVPSNLPQNVYIWAVNTTQAIKINKKLTIKPSFVIDLTQNAALNQEKAFKFFESSVGAFYLIYLNKNQFAAIDSYCTHAGCQVDYTDSAAFVCPCHGSRFNKQGDVVSGPATTNLLKYQTKVINNNILVYHV